MKIAIIGAAGVRTPLIIRSIINRQDKLGLNELALMDIDGKRLELIGALTEDIENSGQNKFNIRRTTDARSALQGADFVITTFRVGGIDSRITDERVPLDHGVLGQETTGAGGFAMGMRSIPVLLDYVKVIEDCCPNAWLINFANPAGMLTEAVLRFSGYNRVVGICDEPTSMLLIASAVLGARPEQVYLDYFGLNHLGWVRRIIFNDHDRLPELIELIKSQAGIPGLRFEAGLVTSLGLIPNEYLYFYYYNKQAVNNILSAGESRGEQIARLNRQLFAQLKDSYANHDLRGMQAAYLTYQQERGETYMSRETGKNSDLTGINPTVLTTLKDEGYAGVALNLIEGLAGNEPVIQILNIANEGSITGMDELDVVEVPAMVSHNHIHPLAAGKVPASCLGLMQQVKQYERLTIEAAVEGSLMKAQLALTIHPLVQDYQLAKSILSEYMQKHQPFFPQLND
jgi:alpha-galactosidase/6-phospho-beta-glucosidase family protein